MKYLIFFFFSLSACVTSAPGTATLSGFSGFPKHFTALQALRVTMKGDEKTVIASLRRDEHDFHVTFLDPAFQTPLLELKTFGPEEQRIRYFVDKDRLPFHPKMILDSIVALFEASAFSRPPAGVDDGVLTLDTGGATYLLADWSTFAGCAAFPTRIDLAFSATKDLETPQVLPRLRVETKELECK